MTESSLKYQNNPTEMNNDRNVLKTNHDSNSAEFFDIYTSDFPSIYPVRHKYGCSCLYTGDLPPYPRLFKSIINLISFIFDVLCIFFFFFNEDFSMSNMKYVYAVIIVLESVINLLFFIIINFVTCLPISYLSICVMFINIIGIIISSIAVGVVDVVFNILILVSNFFLCYMSAHYEKICCCSDENYITPY